MNLQYKEIKLTPAQSAAHTYLFILSDYKEGLNYGVAEKRFIEDGKALADEVKIDPLPLPEGRDAKTYLDYLWSYLRILPKNGVYLIK